MSEGRRRTTGGVAIAVGLAAVVVVLGAYTRLVDAGLGCPDWPGCYGMILVPESAEEIARAGEPRFPNLPSKPTRRGPRLIHRYAAPRSGSSFLALAVLAIKEGLSWKLPVALVILGDRARRVRRCGRSP